LFANLRDSGYSRHHVDISMMIRLASGDMPGIAQVGKQMDTQPAANLEPWRLSGWKRFPNPYWRRPFCMQSNTREHPLSGSENAGLAVRIGDLLATDEKATPKMF